MNMVYVASRFEVSRRREMLSWSHHAALAALDRDGQELWRTAQSQSDCLSPTCGSSFVADGGRLRQPRPVPGLARGSLSPSLETGSCARPAADSAPAGSSRRERRRRQLPIGCANGAPRLPTGA